MENRRQKDVYGLYTRPDGRVARKNKFSFWLLTNKEFRASLRRDFRAPNWKERTMPTNSQWWAWNMFKNNLQWTDDHLLENINSLLSIYSGQPGNRLFFNLRDKYNFRLSTSTEVDKNGKPLRYSQIAYSMDGHPNCRQSASKLFIEAYKRSSIVDHGISIPEKVLNRCAELFAIKWEAYAKASHFNLNIDRDFESIYEVPNMGSCMTSRGYWTMYRDAAKEAQAVSLKNKDGKIVARAILWTCYDEEDNSYRLLDRCYSINSDISLQQVLIDTCLTDGVIDLYKPAGISCHDNQNIKTVDGKSFDKDLYVRLDLYEGDTVSYLDTFAYYDIDKQVAWNSEQSPYSHKLDLTDGFLSGEDDERIYSEYYDEYIGNDVAVWCEDVDSYIDCNDEDFVNCHDDNSYHRRDDCYYVESSDRYYSNNNTLYYAENTEEYYDNNENLIDMGDDGYYYDNGDVVFSNKLDKFIFLWDAIYIKDLDDYDLIDNKDIYQKVVNEIQIVEYYNKKYKNENNKI